MPPASHDDHREPNDRNADQTRDHRAVGVADIVDGAHDIAHDPAARPMVRPQQDAQSAGDSVSALIADKNIATATVTANCRNSSPEIPG